MPLHLNHARPVPTSKDEAHGSMVLTRTSSSFTSDSIGHHLRTSHATVPNTSMKIGFIQTIVRTTIMLGHSASRAPRDQGAGRVEVGVSVKVVQTL
jgi:hypothetical protein